jgi:hypothetical protein
MRVLPEVPGQLFSLFYNGCDVTVLEPWQEEWESPAECTQEQVLAYFLLTVDEYTPDDIPEPYYSALYDRWSKFTNNVRGRMFLRTLVIHLFTPYARLSGPAFCLSEKAKGAMQKTCPDVYQKIMAPFSPSTINIPLLCDIEARYVKLHCRKSKSPEHFLESSLEEALSIDFFHYACIIGLRWYEVYEHLRQGSEWAIPPMQSKSTMWAVCESQFQRRLSWIAPFLPDLLRSEAMRRARVVLSGSLLPLCLLVHQVNTGDETRFLDYAEESYKHCSIDLFVTNSNMSPKEIEMLFLGELGDGWYIYNRRSWSEDSEWAVRARHGHTVYITDSSEHWHIHVVVMSETSLRDAIVHQHLPCVRAYWDGLKLFTTASCCIAWMSRFVLDQPLFGDRIDQQRKSKTVVKYAMRGFGFSTGAIAGLQIPTTIGQWIMDERTRRPLPWYHPLYNPNLWKKAMTPERELALIECAEV